MRQRCHGHAYSHMSPTTAKALHIRLSAQVLIQLGGERVPGQTVEDACCEAGRVAVTVRAALSAPGAALAAGLNQGWGL